VTKLDEEVVSQCLELNIPSISREKIIQAVTTGEPGIIRVAYDVILDHKNSGVRVDGNILYFATRSILITHLCDIEELCDVENLETGP